MSRDPNSLAARLVAAAAKGDVSQYEIARAENVSRETVAGYYEFLEASGAIVEKPPEKPSQMKAKSNCHDHMKPQRDVPYVAKTRVCLRCRAKFKSEWEGNRLCVACHASADVRAGIA